MAKILDGKKVRDEIAKKLKARIAKLKSKPTLAVIQIGDLPESNAYIGQKKLFAEKIGAGFRHLKLSKNSKESEILKIIKKLNLDKKINGIIVQMPIPKGLNKAKIIEAITPIKDVDGLSAENFKKLWDADNAGFPPATAKGISTLLSYYGISVTSKRVVIIGRSSLVGKPTAALLLGQNATVTIAHSKSKNLSSLSKEADILIVAAGVPHLIGARHVKKRQVIIDVGINAIAGCLKKHKLEDEIEIKVKPPKLIGDVDFKAVSKIVKAITPVPGGVGPMTVASLFENLVDAYGRQSVRMK